jgi:predicted Zn finger-like uncharacterized protein
MKIECPNCHLSGNMNDYEIPETGRNVTCPKCKTEFMVRKEVGAGGNEYLMSSCPNCQFSTFSEETFAVCPKCGMEGKQYREMLRKQQETEQKRRNEERLNQSYGPGVDVSIKSAEPDHSGSVAATPTPVKIAGWSSIIVAAGILIYGGVGLFTFYGKNWQAILAETSDEPVSNLTIFVSHGLFPWLQVIYGIVVAAIAYRFLLLDSWSRKLLEAAAWIGAVAMASYELIDFVVLVRGSLSTLTFGYVAGLIPSTLLMLALWVVPPLMLVRYLRAEEIRSSFEV